MVTGKLSTDRTRGEGLKPIRIGRTHSPRIRAPLLFTFHEQSFGGVCEVEWPLHPLCGGKIRCAYPPTVGKGLLWSKFRTPDCNPLNSTCRGLIVVHRQHSTNRLRHGRCWGHERPSSGRESTWLVTTRFVLAAHNWGLVHGHKKRSSKAGQ